MEVYLVALGGNSKFHDDHVFIILGVFESKYKADKYIKDRIKNERDKDYDNVEYRIKRFILNKGKK